MQSKYINNKLVIRKFLHYRFKLSLLLFFFTKIKTFFFFSSNFLWELSNKIIYLEKIHNFSKLMHLKFKWFKFSLFMGLGYKKKISKLNNFLYLYIGDRHWLLLPLNNFFIFTLRRRNLIMFSKSKTLLYYFNNLLKELKKKNIFKIKGFLDVRTRRRWIVVRRLKIRGVIIKLSKKQKLI